MIIGYDVPKYLPSADYFFRLAQCDFFVFLDEMHVAEGHNRTLIKTPNGKMVLTIPIHFKKERAMKDTEIIQGDWRVNHWGCIEKAYTGCKFHHLRDMFRGLLMSRRWKNLANLNIKSIKFVCKMLQIKTKIFRASVHGKTFPDAEVLDGKTFKDKIYPQQHGVYIPGLSVVDFICNTGGQGKYEIVEFFSAK
jgi:hypothetical protein